MPFLNSLNSVSSIRLVYLFHLYLFLFLTLLYYFKFRPFFHYLPLHIPLLFLSSICTLLTPFFPLLHLRFHIFFPCFLLFAFSSLPCFLSFTQALTYRCFLLYAFSSLFFFSLLHLRLQISQFPSICIFITFFSCPSLTHVSKVVSTFRPLHLPPLYAFSSARKARNYRGRVHYLPLMIT